MSLRRFNLTLLLVFAGVLAAATPASASFGYVGGLNMYGGGSSGDLLQFGYAKDIARAATGEFFIVDSENARVVKLSSTGEFLLEWGHGGSADGEFSGPSGVAVSPTTGDVWVSDSGNNRLQRFNQSGGFLGKVGGPTSGTGNGQFNQVGDVAVSPTGVIYATDVFNHRVQFFTDAGVYSGQFGGSGSTDGLFNRPIGIDLASSGDVYVVDWLNYRVQYFSAGTHLFAGKWGCNCSEPLTSFVSASQVFVDKSVSPNEVYVSNNYFDHRIQRFSLTGTRLSKWGPEANMNPGSALGDLNSPNGIYVDAAHNAYVADSGNFRIQLFSGANTSTPTAVEAWGTNGSGVGQLSNPQAVAAAPDGSVYVADAANRRVQHLSAKGLQLHVWGSAGTGNGQFEQMGGIALAPNGDVYVLTYSNEASDADTSKVQWFSDTGVYQGQWNLAGPADPLSYAYDLDIDDAGNVYVSDGGNYRVVKFDSDGTPITSWGQNGTGSGNADFQYNAGIAVNDAGTEVYVTDQTSQRIKKFDGSGAFLDESGLHTFSGSSADGSYYFPGDIAIDPVSGDLYVADSNNHRIQRISPSLDYVSKFGVRGRDWSQFNYPTSVSFDPNGYLFVADRDNDRVQRFGDVPVVTITSPTAGSTVGEAPTVSYTVNDPAADCDVADGASVGPLAPGVNTITVSCTNLRGAGTDSVSVTVPAPPAEPTPPTAPAPSAELLAVAKKLKAGKSLRLKATCPSGCTISASVKIGRRSTKLKSVVLTASADQRGVTLKLPAKTLRKVRAALSAKKPVSLRVMLTSRRELAQRQSAVARLIK